MSEGFIRWFVRDWSADTARSVVAALEHAGWSLTNLTTGRIATIPDLGESISRERLLDRMALDEAESVSFKWWLNAEGSDVIHDIDRLHDTTVVHEFDLDGNYWNLPRIEPVLLSIIRERSSQTIGAVFDRFGASLEVDWNAVMAGSDATLEELPDLLVLAPRIDRINPNFPPPRETYRLDDLVIHDWRGLYPEISHPT